MSQRPKDLAVEFLPDADAIEKTPVARGLPITLYAIIAMMAVFLVWAALSELDQVVVARGKLVSTERNIIIQPIETAQVDELLVTVGQVVKKDELLARLEPTFITADLAQVKEKLQSLNAQIKRLEAERDGRSFQVGRLSEQEQMQLGLDLEKQSGHRARLRRLDENIEKTQHSIVSAQTEVSIYERRLANQLEIEKMTDTLFQKEFQSKRALLDAREKRLEIERDHTNARNKVAELTRELNGLQADRLAYANEYKLKSLEELVSIRRERDGLQEQLNKSDRRSVLIEMRAPMDGIVLEVAKKSRGSVIKEGETLVSMVPAQGELVAEIRVDASEISFVKRDADVRVKIDAFPFQKFGLIQGKLGRLSADALESAAAGVSSGPQNYYSGLVDLKSFDPALRTPDIELKPGMTLTAEIMTQKRSVLSYITYPLRQIRSEAMNER
jgi:HlyD family secretion protein